MSEWQLSSVETKLENYNYLFHYQMERNLDFTINNLGAKFHNKSELYYVLSADKEVYLLLIEKVNKNI